VRQATKSSVGRLRPDFLDRCQPAQAIDYTFQLQFGMHTDVVCTQTNQYLLDDGRSSFPSGAVMDLAAAQHPPSVPQGNRAALSSIMMCCTAFASSALRHTCRDVCSLGLAIAWLLLWAIYCPRNPGNQVACFDARRRRSHVCSVCVIHLCPVGDRLP
jgi:hypothetical protein